MDWINKVLNNNPGDGLLINLKANVLFDIAQNNNAVLSEAIAFFSSLHHSSPADPVNYFYLCKCTQLQEGENKALEMAVCWIKEHAVTNGFLQVDKNELFFNEAMLILRHWETINTYIVTQNPVVRLQDQFYDLNIYDTSKFQSSFEIYRSIFLCQVIELFSKTKSEKAIKTKTLAFFKNTILKRVPESVVCGIITTDKSNLNEFATQASAVIVTLSNVCLTEACRSFGFAVGYSGGNDQEKLIDTVDPSFFSCAILFYGEMIYRHFDLPN